MLFRTPHFLRIACGGTNLEGQIEKDRDALFVQDLPIRERPSCPSEDHDAFGEPLQNLLEYYSTMYDEPMRDQGLRKVDRDRVRKFGEALLADVDFEEATGALVTCMPGGSSGGHKGGWTLLEQALRTSGAPRLVDGRLDIATGHFGAISLPFLAMMARTLRRQQPSAHGEWADVGRSFLYHSSRATVLAPGTNSFAVLRTTAPGNRAGAATDPTLLEKHFHDALPKFERRVDAPADSLTPILHGKVLLATAADGAAAALFVGSQNFSATSWGQGGQQPKNVEVGVVLSAHTREQVRELWERFPIEMAPEGEYATSAAERGYVMARSPTDGNQTETGLQFCWRSRCNDMASLPAWRLFLHRWWKMCSGCRAAGVPCELGRPEMERLAWAGTPFLCAACQPAVPGGRSAERANEV